MLHVVLPANTQNTFKISPGHSRTHFTVKKIDHVHQTGPGKGAEYLAVCCHHARLTFTKSVTVSVAVSKMGVVFIKPGVTVLLESYYLNKCSMLLNMSLTTIFVFQQDSALVHSTQSNCCSANYQLPFSFSPKLWHRNCRELNSTDYEM